MQGVIHRASDHLVDVHSKAPAVGQALFRAKYVYELYMNARVEEPICHSALPLWAMHLAERHHTSCTSCTDANLGVHKCQVADWLAGWHWGTAWKCMRNAVII